MWSGRRPCGLAARSTRRKHVQPGGRKRQKISWPTFSSTSVRLRYITPPPPLFSPFILPPPPPLRLFWAVNTMRTQREAAALWFVFLLPVLCVGGDKDLKFLRNRSADPLQAPRSLYSCSSCSQTFRLFKLWLLELLLFLWGTETRVHTSSKLLSDELQSDALILQKTWTQKLLLSLKDFIIHEFVSLSSTNLHLHEWKLNSLESLSVQVHVYMQRRSERHRNMREVKFVSHI